MVGGRGGARARRSRVSQRKRGESAPRKNGRGRGHGRAKSLQLQPRILRVLFRLKEALGELAVRLLLLAQARLDPFDDSLSVEGETGEVV